MATRFWVGGTGTWNSTSTARWSAFSGGPAGASAPTSADDVVFNNSSHTSGAFTVTTGTGAVCNNFSTSGLLFTMTLTGADTLSVFGSLTLPFTRFTYSLIEVDFKSTTTGNTINTGGLTLNNVYFSGAGGGWTQTSSVICDNIQVSGGTFNTGNFSLTCDNFTSTGATAHTVNLGSSTVTITSTGLNLYSGSLTLNAGTSTINLTSPGDITFNGGGYTFNNVTFSAVSLNNAGAIPYNIAINGANTFTQLTLTMTTGAIKYITFSANQTITTMVISGGGTITTRLFFRSNDRAVRRSLTVTTWASKTDIDFQSIAAVGTTWSGTRLGNAGNNTNITFATARTLYWNLTGAVSWSANGWATSSGGTPSSTMPLAQDTAVFDNAGAATTVSIDRSWRIGVVTMSARTTAMTLTVSASGGAFIYGNVTLGSGVTASNTRPVYFDSFTSRTFNSAGKSISWQLNVTGIMTLGGSLVCTNSLAVGPGATFTPGISRSVTATSFNSSSTATVSDASAWIMTGTGNVWTVQPDSTFTIGAADIQLTSTSTSLKSFRGGSKTYNFLLITQASVAADLVIYGDNTIGAIVDYKTVSHSLYFEDGSTTTITNSLSTAITAGNVLTLAPYTTGSFNLVKTGGGTITVNYATISDSIASPADTWLATNSTDGGGNSGWVFVVPPSTGKFLALF